MYVKIKGNQNDWSERWEALSFVCYKVHTKFCQSFPFAIEYKEVFV